MKIVIFGGSGTGTTTLSKTLAQKLNWTHLDADDFYWKRTAIPFQEKLPQEQRIARLKKAFLKSENTIISGSLVSWGAYWQTAFDLAVFLKLPHEVRMERLKNRELERYGEQLEYNPVFKAKSEKFLAWASKYDNPNFDGRNIALHTAWAKSLNCECIEIGDLSNEDRMNMVLEKIKTLS
ncbi:AAA family ATPase [Roseivirga pacifica]